MSESATGRLVIISGPSGAGKTSVVRALLTQCSLPLELSISATTRPPRPGEVDGVDYYFLSPQQFRQRQQLRGFLESCEVFGRGHLYGTLAEPISTSRQAGKWVILEIDVEGAMKVVVREPDAITIFIGPGSLTELERRLRGRGTETEASIRRRLEVARRELGFATHYQYNVINDDIATTADDLCQILKDHPKKQ